MLKLDITKFKIILARKQMNFKELAESSGISYGTINSWLKNGTGKRTPSPKTIGVLAAALGVDVTELIEN